MSPSPRVVLASGLPLQRPSSFSRQLSVLAEALVEHGVPARVRSAGSVPALLRRGEAKALLLLGYPDQFPWLAAPDLGVPTFLWAQFSHPPEPGALGRALPVPLTPRTAAFLADCPRVGPVIPHGVDTRIYRPPPQGERYRIRQTRSLAGAFVVGTVAAHTLRKRFDRIVEAFARLHDRIPESRLVIKTDRAVALDGSNLPLWVRRYGVESSVRILLGEYGPEEMVELYASMDLYLNLSEWEGFCLPVVEAMSCGVPVAAQPAQGPGEIVPYRDLLVEGSRVESHGDATLLLADPSSAAEVLARAADSPGLLQRLADQGRREAVERYDLRRVAELWGELLLPVTERSPCGPRPETPQARRALD